MPPAVRREVLLPLAPAEAWELVTQPRHLEEWLADDVRIDLRPDGEIVVGWGDGAARRGVVEEVDAPHRLAFRWSEAGAGEGDAPAETRVEFEVSAVSEGSRVLVVETPTRVCAMEPITASLARELGWTIVLERLAVRRPAPV